MKRLIAIVLVVAGVVGGCSREEARPVRKTCAIVKETVRGIYRLETATMDGTAPRFVSLDVDGLSAPALEATFRAFKDPAAVHLWMPSEKSWILVEHASATNAVSLLLALDAFASDESCTVSLVDVLANYVGTLADVMPAFSSDLKGEVVPEWFVPKVFASFPWLSPQGLDGDILAEIQREVGERQRVRRIVLEGAMAARQVKEKGDEEAAVTLWGEAYRENPRDALLLERLEILERNAKGFLEVGKVLQAMKCYETMILVRPNDPVAVRAFGLCLKKLGREDMAKVILSRADELARSNTTDRASEVNSPEESARNP